MMAAGRGQPVKNAPGPSAWRWSRGADVACLVLMMGLIAGAADAARDGATLRLWLCLGAVALLFSGLVIHAATAGRRFGR